MSLQPLRDPRRDRPVRTLSRRAMDRPPSLFDDDLRDGGPVKLGDLMPARTTATPEPAGLSGIGALARRIRAKRNDGEVAAENARTVKAVLKTSDHTDLARLHARAVKDSGDEALAELGDFCSQLRQSDPAACKRWRAAMERELPVETGRMDRALNLVNLEDAAEGDKKALAAVNDELRDTLGTGQPSKKGEIQTALAPLAIPLGAAGLRLLMRSLPLLLGGAAAKEFGEDLRDAFGRTDIADPPETTETLPEHRPDRDAGTESFPQADPLPPLPPSAPEIIENEPLITPDQSDDTVGSNILNITKIDPVRPDELRERLKGKVREELDHTDKGAYDGFMSIKNLPSEYRDAINKRLTADTKIEGGGGDGLTADSGLEDEDALEYFERLVMDLGGDLNAVQELPGGGKSVDLEENIVARLRPESRDGRTSVEIEKLKAGKKGAWRYKFRFGKPTKTPFMRK